MQKLFDLVDSWFIAMAPVTDFLWSFPTNWEWYANIPVIGRFPFAIVLLVGMGIYFTVRTGGVQFRFFKAGIKSLMKKKKEWSAKDHDEPLEQRGTGMPERILLQLLCLPH